MTHNSAETLLRSFLRDRSAVEIPAPVRDLLRDALGSSLRRRGLLRDADDSAETDLWLQHVCGIVRSFSREPWTSQQEIIFRTGLNADQLTRLNAAIRESDTLQKLIVEEGTAREYWRTITQVIRSEALQDALSGEYRPPLQLGIYPGVSCMFSCSFCGRNPNAHYDGKIVQRGNEIFRRLFEEFAPGAGSSCYLSGGLEPLTNPGIEDVIRSARTAGHEICMHTNGYMLTPQLVEKHEGLWDLANLRISLYGTNADSHHAVSQKKDAFDRVLRNTTEFLKRRNERMPGLRIGFNFVILPGHLWEVPALIDLAESIEATVTNGRGLDYISLREDFSVPPERAIRHESRRKLRDVILDFEEQRLSRVPSLSVDYGYALYPLSLGVVEEPLVMASHTEMRSKGYPQICVVVDLLGDVYLFREAGFLDREGAARFKFGTIDRSSSLEDVVRRFQQDGKPVELRAEDPRFMDAFDRLMTVTLNQAEADRAAGIPFEKGPVRARVHSPESIRTP